MKRNGYNLWLVLILWPFLQCHGSRAADRFTTKINRHRKELSQIERKLQTTRRTITILQTQLEKLKQELKENKTAIERTGTEIAEVTASLAAKRKEVRRVTQELRQAEEDYEDRLAGFESRLVYYYKMRHTPLPALLLSSSTFPQFIRRKRYLEILSAHDSLLLERLSASKKRLEDKRRVLETEQEKEHRLVRRLERKKKALHGLVEEQKHILAKMEREYAHARKRAATLAAAERHIKQKLQKLNRAKYLFSRSKEETRKFLNARKAPRKGSLLWPVDGDVVLVKKFGRDTSEPEAETFSPGIDILLTGFTKVHAAADGKVVFRGDFGKTYGKIVIIDHGGAPDNLFTIYGNVDTILVPNHKEVEAGECIAIAGRDLLLSQGGRSRLHFEVRIRTKPVNPLEWLEKLPIKRAGGI